MDPAPRIGTAVHDDFLEALTNDVDGITTGVSRIQVDNSDEEESPLSLSSSNLNEIARPKSRLPVIARLTDVTSEKAEKVLKRLLIIDKKILKIEYLEKEIFENLSWRKCTDVQSETSKWFKKLSDNDVAMGPEEENLKDLWTQVAVTPEKELIPDLLKNIQYLDVSLSIIRQKCQRMHTILAGKTFRNTLEWYKSIVNDCVCIIDGKLGPSRAQLLIDLYNNRFYTTITSEPTTPLDPLVTREIKNIYVEAIDIFLQSMKHATPDLNKISPTERDKWNNIEIQLCGEVKEGNVISIGLRERLVNEINQKKEKRILPAKKVLQSLPSFSDGDTKAIEDTKQWAKLFKEDCQNILKEGVDKVSLFLDLFMKRLAFVTKPIKDLSPLAAIEIKNIQKDIVEYFIQATQKIDVPAAKKEQWNGFQLQLCGAENIKGVLQMIEVQIGQISKGPMTLQPGPLDFQRIVSKGVLRGSYYVQPSFYFSNVVWAMGYYLEAFNVSTSMQELAKGILGLHVEIEECLTSLIRGELVPNSPLIQSSYGDKQKDWDYFHATFEEQLNKLKKDLFSQELNVFVLDVANYAAGLTQTLYEIRISLDLLARFRSRTDLLWEAELQLFDFLKPAAISPISAIKSLEEIEALHAAASKFELIKSYQEEPQKSTIISKFMKKSAGAIQAILANKAPDVLKCTDDENKVWLCITGRETLDNLWYVAESQDGLPTIVRSYLEKRMTEVMFFSDEKYNQEIELLIYMLSTHSKYKKQWDYSVENDQKFGQIYTTYRKKIENSKDSLQDISEIFFCISRAAQPDQRNPLAYGQAWQMLFDFYIKNKKGEELIDSFIIIVQKKLDDIAKTQNYISIPSSKGVFFSETGPIIKELSSFYLDDIDALISCDEELGALEALFYRALGCCIWGKKDSERKDAHQLVGKFFECDFVQNHVQSDLRREDIKMMIYENAIQKILTGDLDTIDKKEFDLLREGPIAKYLETGMLPMNDPRIIYVLLHFVKTNNQFIIQDMINAMGEAGMKNWKDSMEQFLHGLMGFQTESVERNKSENWLDKGKKPQEKK